MVGSVDASERGMTASAAGAVAVGAVITPADAGVAREAAPVAAPACAVAPVRSPAPAPRPAASAPPRATLEKATGVRPAQLLRKERGGERGLTQERDHGDRRDGRSNDHDPADVVTGASS